MFAQANHQTSGRSTGLLAIAILGIASAGCSPRIPVEEMAASYQEQQSYPPLTIRYPLNETVFPPEIVPCTFSWREETASSDAWLVLVQFSDQTGPLAFVAETNEWTPAPPDWETIKRQSKEKPAKVTILGFQRAQPRKFLSQGQVSIRTSPDPVGAPLFYREVNLPFMEAVKDPSRIRWRFGSIDSPTPPRVVLTGLPVCGNCHSFSQDGQVLGMDVDYANDKGSYIITRVDQQMTLASSDVITWSSYKREDNVPTFGFLSRVSPDGQTVVSTVKDKSVFVAKPDLEFSQLFFPIRGILAVYHRNDGTFHPLPGADDPRYVQSNPVWSPDGREILFARAEAYQMRSRDAEGKLLLSPEDCAEFLQEGKIFQFDLYRLPYNDGRGGKPEPVRGASHNGKSNFFPKYSPDGKWIVFCQASSFMLLQPDSELFIIPAAGGEPRRLRCNTPRMNSWHSWSPNGKWLVFSSKANSAYTQLFLTHLDDAGESTPPVRLAHFTSPNGAANIPEFVNTSPDAIVRIQAQFLDDHNHARRAYVMEVNGDIEGALAAYLEALKINPKNVHAHQRVGFLLFNHKRQFKEGLAHTLEALRLDPHDGCAHYDFGMALQYQGQLSPAIQHLAEAVRLLPAGFDRRYSPVDMRSSLGQAYLANGDAPKAEEILLTALSLNPTNAATHYVLAMATAAQGKHEASLRYYHFVRQHAPQLDTSAELHLLFASNFAQNRLLPQAIEEAQKALDLARAAGDADLVKTINDQLAEFKAGAGP